MKDYEYKLTTDDGMGNGYVVIQSDGLSAIMDYAKTYTKDRPLMHLRLWHKDKRVAVIINGKYYVEVTESVILTTIAEEGEE